MFDLIVLFDFVNDNFSYSSSEDFNRLYNTEPIPDEVAYLIIISIPLLIIVGFLKILLGFSQLQWIVFTYTAIIPFIIITIYCIFKKDDEETIRRRAYESKIQSWRYIKNN